MLAEPMARDLGVATPTVYAAFSVALAVSALVGPGAGRLIDHHGGRPVLMATNVLFAAALAALGLVQNALALFAAWALLGVAMGSGLYEAAFASLVRLYGQRSRNAITGITLMAGFASTVGWPLSAWLESRYGWRGACFTWAGLHLLLGLPLNAVLPTAGPHPDAASSGTPAAAAAAGDLPPGRSVWVASVLLAFVFAAAWFISTAMAAHLPRMMQAAGASLSVAVAVGALVGPAQVAGRLLEFGLLRHVHPLLSARLAALAHPVGAIALLLGGPALAPLFVVLHGAGNGILTIAKGTLPLALFGPAGYGARQGWLMLPSRVAQALAPFLFGIVIDSLQAGALWFTAGLGLAAFAALLALRSPASMHPS
ncbi:MFS transporter [Rubrivivax sp. A210]|uniref:MFS transporter n=1 Tax=Rubrivivax sp. A210 TaxID=2772301 RepID=UPI0019191007